MQRHRPMASSGHKVAVDRLSFRSCPARRTLEADRQVLMVSTLPGQIAGQTAILGDAALHDRRALEGIEREAFVADGHQALGGRTTGFVCWHDRADPATLQTMPRQHAARLQPLADIPLAPCDKPNRQGRGDARGKNSGHMKAYPAVAGSIPMMQNRDGSP